MFAQRRRNVHTVFVEKAVADHPRTRRMLQNLRPDRVLEIDSATDLPVEEPGSPSRPGRDLVLARFRGRFFKRCPGTQRHICCGYRVLNIQTGCDLGCTYCVLQGYLNSPLLTVYVNLEDALREVETTLRRHPNRFFRVGTGELTDSLFLDEHTGTGRELIQFFVRQDNAILELKTKTASVDHLLDLDPRGRIILSWSLNPDPIVEAEEGTSARLDERLEAASRAEQAGYRLGFHFDPLVHFPNWRDEYRRTVRALFSAVRPSSVVWISLGALRYPPHLDRLIRERHPDSPLPLGELFPGVDCKFRYLRPIRVEMFRTLHQEIRRHAPDVFVYLCMESDLIWRESLGWSPRSTRTLAKLMDDQARSGLR